MSFYQLYVVENFGLKNSIRKLKIRNRILKISNEFKF
ncbi:hypothetical protein [Flavobacterium aquicola]